MHSSLPRMWSICILVMMASCSTWTDSEPSPKPPVSSSEICCSRMMPLLQFTLWWSSAPHKQLLQSLWWLRSHNQHYKHWGQGAGHLIFTLHLSQWHDTSSCRQSQITGSHISDNLSLDTEINARIGKAAIVMSKLTKIVWENKNLTLNTQLKVYKACVISTLLYGCEAWTTYDMFHTRCLRRFLCLTWKDKVTNFDDLSKTKSFNIFAMLSQRRLLWLGHAHGERSPTKGSVVWSRRTWEALSGLEPSFCKRKVGCSNPSQDKPKS